MLRCCSGIARVLLPWGAFPKGATPDQHRTDALALRGLSLRCQLLGRAGRGTVCLMAEIRAVWAIHPAAVVPGLAANGHRRNKLPR